MYSYLILRGCCIFFLISYTKLVSKSYDQESKKDSFCCNLSILFVACPYSSFHFPFYFSLHFILPLMLLHKDEWFIHFLIWLCPYGEKRRSGKYQKDSRKQHAENYRSKGRINVSNNRRCPKPKRKEFRDSRGVIYVRHYAKTMSANLLAEKMLLLELSESCNR